MAYTVTLSGNQSLYIEQQGNQTRLILSHQTPGQQQSQSNAFDTGGWIVPPILFRAPLGLILQLESSQGKTFLLLQGSQVQILTTAPLLADADILPLQKVEDASPAQSSLPPLPPLPPMKMGDMTLQMNPMQMQMGDMTLKMGTPASASAARFCSHCGSSVKRGDRFCAQCGHSLQD